MESRGNHWAVVLAAGDGTRLRPLTMDDRGVSVPKQFCSFRSDHSLLRQSIERCQGLVPNERTLVVVAADHRRWWRRELADLRPENLVVQPCNRGTACGVLLPLVTVLARDPEAVVTFMPSDHLVAREDVLIEAMDRAGGVVRAEGRHMVLLGLAPESADPTYGWITPSKPVGPGLFEVLAFEEKPARERASELISAGALWNSFIFVARAAALMDLFAWTMPWLTRLFTHVQAAGGIRRREALGGLYEQLPALDFSRDVLQGVEDELRVLAVPPCGWVDLGTPERIEATMERQQSCPVPSTGATAERQRAPLVDLAEAVMKHRRTPDGAQR